MFRFLYFVQKEDRKEGKEQKTSPWNLETLTRVIGSILQGFGLFNS